MDKSTLPQVLEQQPDNTELSNAESELSDIDINASDPKAESTKVGTSKNGGTWLPTKGRAQTPRKKRFRQTDSPASHDEGLSPDYILSRNDSIESRIHDALIPFHEEMDIMKQEVKHITEENRKLSEKCTRMDIQARKGNLKIWGIIEQKKKLNLISKGQYWTCSLNMVSI